MFRLGALSAVRTSCGHQRPDVQEQEPRDLGEPATKVKTVTLSLPQFANVGCVLALVVFIFAVLGMPVVASARARPPSDR